MSTEGREVEGREDEEEPKPKHQFFDEDEYEEQVREPSREEEPITIGQLFKNTVKRFPKHPALKYKMGMRWEPITFTGYYDRCIKAAKSFLEVRVDYMHVCATVSILVRIVGDRLTK